MRIAAAARPATSAAAGRHRPAPPVGTSGRPRACARAAARRTCRGPAAAAASAAGRSASAVDDDAGPSRRALLLTALLGLPAGLLLVDAAGASSITKVFVAGSTGNTGRRVVQALRAQGFAVRAGVRDPKKAAALGYGADGGIEVVTADVLSGAKSLAAAIGDAQAVICATGYTGFNPSGFGQVDETGTLALVDAAKAQGVSKFVLVSSLLTNARAVGQADNPNFKFLNLFGGVLEHKLVAERYIKASGMDYTIIRPGGLSNEPEAAVGRLVAAKEDSLFGLETDPGREISRDTVAAVAVAALVQPSASNKVVEVVASPSAPPLAQALWFP